MEKFSPDLNGIDMAAASRLAQSDAAKQLFAMLQHSDPGALQAALQQASAGNYTKAKELLQKLMADESAGALLRKIQEDAHG